jgi:hypothetical protein
MECVIDTIMFDDLLARLLAVLDELRVKPALRAAPVTTPPAAPPTTYLPDF